MPDVIKQPLKFAGGFLEEFKGFALKGNMIDLAVGVVIGTAFTGVVNALVNHIFMPLIGYVTPSQSYRTWMLGRIEIGAFLAALVNFLIIALAVFVMIKKLIGLLVRHRSEAAEPPAEPVPPDVALLTEIRDLLRQQNAQAAAAAAVGQLPIGGVAGTGFGAAGASLTNLTGDGARPFGLA